MSNLQPLIKLLILFCRAHKKPKTFLAENRLFVKCYSVDVFRVTQHVRELAFDGTYSPGAALLAGL